MYEPSSPRLVIVKSRISQRSWNKRVEAAQKTEKIVLQLMDRVKGGDTLNGAVKELLPARKRSWAIRSWMAYRKHGFEGLIDTRLPRDVEIPRSCLEAVRTARMANPKLSVSEVLEILQAQNVTRLPSVTTIKREFQKADQSRRRAEQTQQEQVIDLPLAGGELLLAAELETGMMKAITDEVEKIAKEAREASVGRERIKDVKGRDRRGHFTASYNRARKRKDDEEIASYLRPADQKGAAKIPAWPRFVREPRFTVHRKVVSLTFESLVNRGHGWDGLRASGMTEALGPLSGYPYMPSTLSKMTSALAQSGAGPRFLEAVGLRWHEVSQQNWDERGSMAALYVDNHAKEVWSNLFTKAGKVSHRSRVMPCITTTYVHTGAGVAVWLALQSGSAPLAPRLEQIVEQAEKSLDEEIKRLVVIDAEGSTFDILSSFTEQGRVIVTPMKPSQTSNVELRYGRGSFYRPFREHDEYRVATATLLHKRSGRSLELDAVVIRREGRGRDTVLLTNGPRCDVPALVVAEAYFNRWPVQENAFKHGAAAAKLNHHRGNSAQMVTNVAVISELEKLEGRIITCEQKLGKLSNDQTQLEQKVNKKRKDRDDLEAQMKQAKARIDELRRTDSPNADDLADSALQLHDALARKESTDAELQRAEKKLFGNHVKREALLEKIAQMATRADVLEPMQKIRQLDVALDEVLTAFKLTATALIMYVLRVYFPGRAMTPETFVSRVLSFRGRRIVSSTEETVVFSENPRDPEMSSLLESACDVLNKRSLTRDGKALHYKLERINLS